jgi:hypothetical protein
MGYIEIMGYHTHQGYSLPRGDKKNGKKRGREDDHG